MFHVLLILLSMISTSTTTTLVGYECGSNAMNVTDVSYMEVGKCHVDVEQIQEKDQYIQLLQLNEYAETMVRQCKIEVHRTVYYCGMNSHVSMLMTDENEYLKFVGREACEDMHKKGEYEYQRMKLTNLIINNTVNIAVTLAGNITGSSTCTGEDYSDYFGSFKNAVVQGYVKVTLMEQLATINLQSNKIILRSGATCALSDGYCIDNKGGDTFWNSIPTNTCKNNMYSVLFEGTAKKFEDLYSRNVVFSISSDNTSFSLSTKGMEHVCNYRILKTEHPKLFIVETVKENEFGDSTQGMAASNLDMFAYVNSKFVYVEKHVRTQIKNLYEAIMLQKCELEMSTIKTSLSLAIVAPDQFAFDFMKGPGYMAIVTGESISFVQCAPVQVVVQYSDKCYEEIQVSRNNETFYLTARSHILKRTGTEIPCSEMTPTKFFVNNEWIKLLPKPITARDPIAMTPNETMTGHYSNPADLGSSVIYNNKQLAQIKDRIMLPLEKSSIVNNMFQEVSGRNFNSDDGPLSSYINSYLLKKIVSQTWTKLWDQFLSFGTFGAACFAIYTIFYFFKLVLDISVHGYTLFSKFGWSFYLLAALFSSLTTYFLHSVNLNSNRAIIAERVLQDVENQILSNVENTNTIVTDEGNLSVPSYHVENEK